MRVIASTCCAGALFIMGCGEMFHAQENVTTCSQSKQLYQIKKSCIIYVVAAVALQAQDLLVQGASARTCGSVGTCQSLAGVFFVIRADKYWGMVDLEEFYKFIMQETMILCYN